MDSNSDNSCHVNFVIPTLKGAGGSSHDSCHTDAREMDYGVVDTEFSHPYGRRVGSRQITRGLGQRPEERYRLLINLLIVTVRFQTVILQKQS